MDKSFPQDNEEWVLVWPEDHSEKPKLIRVPIEKKPSSDETAKSPNDAVED